MARKSNLKLSLKKNLTVKEIVEVMGGVYVEIPADAAVPVIKETR